MQVDNITVEAEKALISELIRHPYLLSDVLDVISPEDLAEPRHSIILEAITEINNQGRKVGFTNLVDELNKQNNLEKIGSDRYLLEIVSADAPHNIGASADESARIIKTSSIRRKMEILGREIVEQARPGSGDDPESLMQYAESAIFRIAQSTERAEESSNFVDMFPQLLNDMYEKGEAEEGTVFGVPTGFPSLDGLTTGFHPGQFIIIAARPGMGKSTLAIDFARHAAYRAGKSIMFFSLEMNKTELAQRIVSAESRVELANVRSGKLSLEEWEKIAEISERFLDSNLMIDDSPNMTITQIRSKALRQKNSEAGLDMVIVDYLQLMRSAGRVESRQQEVSEISRSLKLLAKELEIPVISLSQLNRGSENRADKRPLISDLRESGSLEQDADIILLIHRPEATDPNERPGQADLILAKNRNGGTDSIDLLPLLSFSKFIEDIKHGREEPPTEEEAELYPPPDEEYSEPPEVPENISSIPFDARTGEIADNAPAW